MDYIISFLLGVFSSLFATVAKPKFYIFLNKLPIINGGLTPFRILHESPSHKNYNNIILLDINEEEFSDIANKFMKEGKNTKVFITNIKQPEWFYSTFKNSVYSKAGKNETVQRSLQAFEYFVKSDLWVDADQELEEIIDLFYKGNEKDIIVFPHLRSFGNSKIKPVRISFLDLNLEDGESKNAFKDKNEKCHVYFFEKFINHNVESLYQRINRYKGTDALILNNKIILNHDDSINELHYQSKSVKKGFFHNVINDYQEKEKKYKYTSEILKEIYEINIKRTE